MNKCYVQNIMKLEKVIVIGENKNSISLGNLDNIDWF